MAEALKSPVAIHWKFREPRGVVFPRCSICSQRESNFSLINGRKNRKHALVNPINNVSAVGSRRRINDDAVIIAGFRHGFVQEEDEDDEDALIPTREDGIDVSCYDPKLSPPWGSCEIDNDRTSIGPGGGTSSSWPSSSSINYSGRPRASVLETNLHFLEERDENTLSKRILSLSKSNKFTSALELYLSMEVTGIRPSPHACNSLLSCLLRNGLLNDALRVFEMMKNNKTTTSHTFSLILKQIASSQGCDSALKMFMELEGEDSIKHNFDAILYNTMISICGEASNWAETERMWRNLKENGHRATSVTYGLLISIFARCGQPELAFDAYHEMKENGMRPTQHMEQAVIAACTKEGKWALALCVFQGMLNPPDECVYNALINSLGKAGEVGMAFRVFDLMRSSGHTPNSYTWNALIVALNREKRYVDALGLFDSIGKEQINSHHLFNAALVSCQRLGLWERSLQLLWVMEGSGLPVSTSSYNLAISACEAARKPRVALQVYQHMIHKSCSPDTFTYMSLVRACIWGSLWSEVGEILDHVPADASLYNAVVQGMCLQGKMASARKVYVKMRESGLKADGKTRALMIQNFTKGSVRPRNRYPPGRAQPRPVGRK